MEGQRIAAASIAAASIAAARRAATEVTGVSHSTKQLSPGVGASMVGARVIGESGGGMSPSLEQGQSPVASASPSAIGPSVTMMGMVETLDVPREALAAADGGEPAVAHRGSIRGQLTIVEVAMAEAVSMHRRPPPTPLIAGKAAIAVQSAWRRYCAV